MKSLFKNYRMWWQVPRNAGELVEHRQVSFLELFYDLVYVALIARLAHDLSSHIHPGGIATYVFLFITVWWAWINGSFYHDLHGNNDMRTRVFTFMQMFAVVAMAIFAHDAMGENAAGFALSFAAFQLILTVLWWRTGVHDPDHRPLSVPYVVVFLINTILFIVSVFLEEPVRFYLWYVAVGLSLLLPLNAIILIRDPKARKQIDLAFQISPSMVERFGLLSIIVLGEVVVGVVSGATKYHMDYSTGVATILGVLVAIGIWWLYFDFLSHRRPKPVLGFFFQWYYLHLPVVMGIAAIGAAMTNMILLQGESVPKELKWLFLGSLAVVLICISLLIRTVRYADEYLRMARTGGIIMLFSALAILGIGFLNLGSIGLLSAVSVLLLIPVFIAFLSWVKEHGS